MGYTTEDVCRASGLNRRVMDYWHKLGILRPAIAEGFQGGGGARRYSADQLRACVAVGQLAGAFKAGIPVAIVREVVRAAAEGAERVVVTLGPGAVLTIELGQPDVDSAA